MMKHFFFFFCFQLPFSLVIFCEQPVMGEVPRWNNGYGFQIFQEYRWSTKVLDDGQKISGHDSYYYKSITHIEGVYTWRKWIRVTAKVPIVYQERKIDFSLSSNGRDRSFGLEDVKIALPLKYYFNKEGYSGNFGFTPQLRFGLFAEEDYPTNDESVDPGFSIGFERETPIIKFNIDATFWLENKKGKENELDGELGLAWNFHDQGSIGSYFYYKEEMGESRWLGGGFAFFWNLNDTFMFKVQYTHALYEYEKEPSLTRGNSIRLGLGVIF